MVSCDASERIMRIKQRRFNKFSYGAIDRKTDSDRMSCDIQNQVKQTF